MNKKNPETSNNQNAQFDHELPEKWPGEGMGEVRIPNRLSTGVAELDEILEGGLIARRAYLVRGDPGCGKTTLGLHFLMAGVARYESTLFINLGESQECIYANAGSIGVNMKDVAFLDLSVNTKFFTEMEDYNSLDFLATEAGSIAHNIIRQIEMLKPQRVFLDTMTQLRILSPDTFQFRRQVLAFLNFLAEQEATILFTSECSDTSSDEDLQAISDGTINLVSTPAGRKLFISKFRGSGYRPGQHAIRLTRRGLELFPRLPLRPYVRHHKLEQISSGMPELDSLLHGGVMRETITLVTGPTGVGKTMLGLQFMAAAASRGERSLICPFEEWDDVLLERSESINMPMRAMRDAGLLFIERVEALYYTADEFSYLIRKKVEEEHISIVMIDSMADYRLSVQGDDLVYQLHNLCKYLQNVGVTVLLINEVDEIGSDFRVSDWGIDYIADNVIFLRYFESQGELHKAVGVLKKRLTDFEKSMRELEITSYGIKIGQPLTELTGILGKMPLLPASQIATKRSRTKK